MHQDYAERISYRQVEHYYYDHRGRLCLLVDRQAVIERFPIVQQLPTLPRPSPTLLGRAGQFFGRVIDGFLG